MNRAGADRRYVATLGNEGDYEGDPDALKFVAESGPRALSGIDI